MRQLRLPAGSANIFQKVRGKWAEAEPRRQSLPGLSIGEPNGPALLNARQAAATAMLSDGESMHAYQNFESPAVPDFSRRFIRAHLNAELPSQGLDYLPVPGIRPILGLLPLAYSCARGVLSVATMTKPGYPVPTDWCDNHANTSHYALALNAGNAIRFAMIDAPSGTYLLMPDYRYYPLE
jgi:aspartate/methionine/tyrosine aminotransferase